MSSNNRTANTQGRPLRPVLGSSKSAGSPLTPRLAATAATASSALRGRTTAFTPDGARAGAGTATSRSRSPVKDTHTPVKSFLKDNATPRSSSRKPRPGEPFATPPAARGDTPSNARIRAPNVSTPLTQVTGRLGNGTVHTPSVSGLGRPKSVVGGIGRERTTSPPLVRSPGEVGVAIGGIDQLVRETTPMFFHANAAKEHEPSPKDVPVKKNPTFFYANGEQEQRPVSGLRAVSPALSVVSDRRTPAPFLQTNCAPDALQSHSTPLVSPALSALSSRSPFFHSPVLDPPGANTTFGSRENTASYFQASPSPVIILRPEGQKTVALPSAAVASRPALSNQRKSSLGVTVTVPVHSKSASMSTIEPVSPDTSRRRSATNVVSVSAVSPLAMKGNFETVATPPSRSPLLPTLNTSTPEVSSPSLIQSPNKAVAEWAAEARRDRKVLDLEISNSSLLAINRSLEREMAKQKAELKRYRRLSRAGRFSVSADAVDMLPTLDEDDLPDFDGDESHVGRPSSPFEEDVTDMISDDDEEAATQMSPEAQADHEARQRAKDEEKLEQDLRKHRQLLLHTQRMNRSIQRCLTWTEDLIKDGKKALAHSVRSTDVNLGGRILDGEESEDADLQQDDSDQTVEENDLAGVEAFLGINFKEATSGRISAESARTDSDSGIEVGKLRGKIQTRSGAEVPRSESQQLHDLGETF